MFPAAEPAARLTATALHDAALMVICPQCLAQPGIACLPRPAGQHVARYSRAYKDGRLTVAEVTAVFDTAPVIANWAVVTTADLEAAQIPAAVAAPARPDGSPPRQGGIAI